jgi:membrane AbrB-like protein
MPAPVSKFAEWGALAALTALGTLAVQAVGVAGATLFAAMLVGLARGLLMRRALTFPPRLGIVAFAALGVQMGTYISGPTAGAVVDYAVPLFVVTSATIAISLAAGVALGRMTGLDLTTASFGMIAGGVAGLIAISDEAGADARLVAVVQYLRVLFVALLTPVAAGLVFAASDAALAGGPAEWPRALLFVTVAGALGLALTRVVYVPGGSMLGPMLVAGALTVVDAPIAVELPALLRDVTFALIGLQVGLRFTLEGIRTAAEILPAALGLIALQTLACAAVGVGLAAMTPLTQLDAYLATTPGGLYIAVALAVGSDSATTFVLAAQVLRLVVTMLAAPLIASVATGQLAHRLVRR